MQRKIATKDIYSHLLYFLTPFSDTVSNVEIIDALGAVLKGLLIHLRHFT